MSHEWSATRGERTNVLNKIKGAGACTTLVKKLKFINMQCKKGDKGDDLLAYVCSSWTDPHRK